jgi:hypothetical protein
VGLSFPELSLVVPFVLSIQADHVDDSDGHQSFQFPVGKGRGFGFAPDTATGLAGERSRANVTGKFAPGRKTW